MNTVHIGQGMTRQANGQSRFFNSELPRPPRHRGWFSANPGRMPSSVAYYCPRRRGSTQRPGKTSLAQLLVAVSLLLTPFAARAQTNDAVSREVSIFNFGLPSISVEAISREISLYNFGQPTTTLEAISREVSIYNSGQPSASAEAISREVSLFNSGQPTTTLEAISREVSVVNAGGSSISLEAISRELSVYNAGQPATTLEAISREVSVFMTTNALPDLAVTLLSTPASATGGNLIPVIFAITNRDIATAFGPWTNSILLSADTNGLLAQTIGSAAFTNSLAAGDSVTLTQMVRLPINAYGNYFLEVYVDSAGNVLESVEGNNKAFSPIAVSYPVLPDLAGLGLSVTNAALAGQLVTVYWSVTNQGAALAAAPWQETLSLADNPAGSNATPFISVAATDSLAVSNSVIRSQSVILPAGLSGNYWFVLQVDSADQVFEGYGETNNFFVAPQPILIQSPDLSVSLLTSAATAVFGQPLAVTWTVTNSGTGPALGNWSDRIYLSANSNSLAGATALATMAASVSPLLSGASYTNSATAMISLNAQSKAGSYWLVASADDTGVVAESNEQNNLRSVPMTLALPPLPDLTVGQVFSDAYGLPGQSASVNWAVTNLGPVGLTNAVWSEAVYLLNDTGLDPTNAAGRLTPVALVATFTLTNTLPSGAFLLRTQSIAIPMTVETGNLRFAVLVDSANDMIESAETNNLALATNALSIPAILTLQLPVSQLLEGSPAVVAIVSRNGSTALPLTVTLTNTDPAQLAVTNFLVIPAGQSSAQFTIQAVHDGIVEGTQLATIIASALGFQGASQTLVILDADLPNLLLSLPTNAIEGGSFTATIRRDYVTSNALPVLLHSSNPSRVNPPLSLIIPGGTNSLTFTIATIDDDIIQAPETITVSATASGFTGGSAAVTLLDNDLPAITLTLAQTNISEGAGPYATIGTLTRWPVTARPVFLALASSNTNAARVPSSLTIPQNQASVTFPVGAVDNTIIDGSKPTLITAYVLLSSVGPQLGIGASAWLTVNDDDGPSFKLTVARKLVAEGLSPATTATISINFTTNQPIIVQLTSSDTNEAVVPATVTIPASQTSATFNIISVNDGVADGNKTVTITASAIGIGPGSDTLTVTDINLPDLVVSSITAPTAADTLSSANIGYRILNQGLTPAGSNWTTRVSLSLDPVAGTNILLGNFAFNGSLPPGQSYDQTVSLPVPLTAGDYWVVVQTDIGNDVLESREDNNTTASAAPIHVQSAYEAWVRADLHSALAGTPIPMHGSAYKGTTNTPAPANSSVNIHIFVRGTHRIIAAQADANGNFTTVWNPLPTEAGVYQIGAAHPGDATAPVQDTFRLVGMSATPSSASVSVIDQSSVSGQIQLANLSDQPLTGLSVSSVGGPANLQVTASLSTNVLAGLDQVTLNYVVAANNTSVLQGTATLHVTSSEGATVDVPLIVVVLPLRAQLVANPTAIYSGMKRGQQTIFAFDLMNQGGTNSGPISVSLPAAVWLSLAVTNPLPSIAPGQTNRVTLLLSPAVDLPLGDFTGSLVLSCDSSSVNVPFTFRSLSEAIGNLRIIAVDDYTYYAQGSPNVTNANVTITDAITQQVVTNGVTDSQGVFLATGLAESYYQIQVTADKHTVYQGTQLLVPGQTTDVTAFMARQTVSYVWTVTPVPFEDRVTITVTTIFETFVPIPVVTVDPAFIDLRPLTTPGQQMQVDLHITNHGLIAANHGRLTPSSNPNYQVVPLITDLGTIPAQTTWTVPLTITYSPPNSGNAAKARAVSADESGNPCSLSLMCSFDYPCGPTLNQCDSDIPFGIPGCPGGYTGGGSVDAAGRTVHLNPIALSPFQNCDCPAIQVDGSLFLGPAVFQQSGVRLSVPGTGGGVLWTVVEGEDKVTLSDRSGNPIIAVGVTNPVPSGFVRIQASFAFGSQQCTPLVDIPNYRVFAYSKSLWPENRERTKIGVGELIYCRLDPSDPPADWQIIDQPGTSASLPVDDNPGGKVLHAGKDPGDIQLAATVDGTDTAVIKFSVVRPSAVYMKETWLGKFHQPYKFSTAFFPRFCIWPTDVSFENLRFGEGKDPDPGPHTGSLVGVDFALHRGPADADNVFWKTDVAGGQRGFWDGYIVGYSDVFLIPFCDELPRTDGVYVTGQASGTWAYWWGLKDGSYSEPFDLLVNYWELTSDGRLIGQKYGWNSISLVPGATPAMETFLPSDCFVPATSRLADFIRRSLFPGCGMVCP